MYYVYVLQSKKNNSFYIGYTEDLKKRFKEHNNGENISTKPFRPYALVFYEALIHKKDAISREKYLKSGWGFRTIKKMLKNYLANVNY
jgi:putative endonuclease